MSELAGTKVCETTLIGGKTVSAHVLILSDDQEAARIWSHALNTPEVEPVTKPYGNLEELSKNLHIYKLIIVDDYLNASDGLDICRVVRAANANALMLFTYESSERYHLKAYQMGVDECVSKPIGIRLCQQKVFAWLRRMTQMTERVSSSTELEVSGFRLDGRLRVLTLPNGRTAKLSRLEHRLMHVFMANPGKVLETELLISRVWSHDYASVDRQILKNLVYRLRKKIELVPQNPQFVKIVARIGYTFEAIQA